MSGKTRSRGARLSAIRAIRTLTIFLAALAIVALAPHPARASTLKTLHTFCSESQCGDGEFPTAGLTQDSSGVLYGTTSGLGSSGGGTVFELSP